MYDKGEVIMFEIINNLIGVKFDGSMPDMAKFIVTWTIIGTIVMALFFWSTQTIENNV